MKRLTLDTLTEDQRGDIRTALSLLTADQLDRLGSTCYRIKRSQMVDYYLNTSGYCAVGHILGREGVEGRAPFPEVAVDALGWAANKPGARGLHLISDLNDQGGLRTRRDLAALLALAA